MRGPARPSPALGLQALDPSHPLSPLCLTLGTPSDPHRQSPPTHSPSPSPCPLVFQCAAVPDLEPASPGSAELGGWRWLYGAPLGNLPQLRPDKSLRIFPLTYCHFGVQSLWAPNSAPSDAA